MTSTSELIQLVLAGPMAVMNLRSLNWLRMRVPEVDKVKLFCEYQIGLTSR